MKYSERTGDGARGGQVGTQTCFYAHDLCCQNVEWILNLNTSEQSCSYFVAMQILIDVAVSHVAFPWINGMKITLLIKSTSIEAEPIFLCSNIVFPWSPHLSLEILIHDPGWGGSSVQQPMSAREASGSEGKLRLARILWKTFIINHIQYMNCYWLDNIDFIAQKSQKYKLKHQDIIDGTWGVHTISL